MKYVESSAEKTPETDIEIEKVVLPQVVSIKKASEIMGLPPYYLRRLWLEYSGRSFLGVWPPITMAKRKKNNTIIRVCQGCRWLKRQPTSFAR